MNECSLFSLPSNLVTPAGGTAEPSSRHVGLNRQTGVNVCLYFSTFFVGQRRPLKVLALPQRGWTLRLKHKATHLPCGLYAPVQEVSFWFSLDVLKVGGR